MKNVKYVPHFFSMYDHTGIKNHLEKMAQKGWMLEKTGSFVWKYRRIEPKKVHFAINYFPKASEFAPAPTEEQKIMFEYCEQAGWKLVATVAQMQIFCNEQENPVPLETDAITQTEIVSKAMKSSFLPAQIFLCAIGILQIGLFLWRFAEHPINILTDGMNLFTGLCWISVILLTAIELRNYFTWLKRARTVAEQEGAFVETRSFPILQIAVLVIVFAGFLFAGLFSKSVIGIGMIIFVAGYTIILIAGVNFMKKFLKSRNFSTGTTRILTLATSFALAFSMMFFGVRFVLDTARNIDEKQSGVETYEYRGITWEIYQDELPLILEDFMDVDYEDYSYRLETSETVLAAEYEAEQRPRMDALEYPDLDYRIVKVKVPLFYEMCKKEMFEKVEHWRNADGYVEEQYREQYKAIDAKNWQADEAYREYIGDEPKNNFLICWRDKIVEISFDTFEDGIQDEWISIVAGKLKDF